MDAAAIAQADAGELTRIEAGPTKRFGPTLLRDKYTRKPFPAEGKRPAAEASPDPARAPYSGFRLATAGITRRRPKASRDDLRPFPPHPSI